MEFLRLDAPNEPPFAEPTMAVFEHKGHVIYVPLEIAESERESEAYRLLGLEIQQERAQEKRLKALRKQVRQAIDLDADTPLGTGENTDVDAILLAIKWLFAEIKDLRGMNMKAPQEAKPIQ